MNDTGEHLVMDSFPKISIHLGFFGSGSDRYNPDGYKNAASPAERIRLASKVRGLDGVESNYPALVNEETVTIFSTLGA
jgi:hypothetical protein